MRQLTIEVYKIVDDELINRFDFIVTKYVTYNVVFNVVRTIILK